MCVCEDDGKDHTIAHDDGTNNTLEPRVLLANSHLFGRCTLRHGCHHCSPRDGCTSNDNICHKCDARARHNRIGDRTEIKLTSVSTMYLGYFHHFTIPKTVHAKQRNMSSSPNAHTHTDTSGWMASGEELELHIRSSHPAQ